MLFLAIFYLSLSFFIVEDYGITWDEPENFGVGHKYWHFMKTGHLEFLDRTPEYAGHPDFYHRFRRFSPVFHWPFTNILSAITCEVFFHQWGLLDPISAHHIIIPILTTLFILLLFFYGRRFWGEVTALISVVLILTYPRFWGHSFNNIKDIPELIFFSLTILFFALWVRKLNTYHYYMGWLFFGFAFATKMDAVLIPPILLLWVFCSLSFKKLYQYFRDNLWRLLHLLGGFLVFFFVIFVSWLPFFSWPWKQSRTILESIIRYIGMVGKEESISWNIYSFEQIFFLTPEITLILFFIGLVYTIFHLRRHSTYSLLLIWTGLPLIRHCLPGANHYDGMRHFIIFLVPAMIIAALGVKAIGEIAFKRLGAQKAFIMVTIVFLIFAQNGIALIQTHPYQTTYFNHLIGGLWGAQKRDFPYSCDYWLNSFKDAARWLDQNAKQGSYYYAYPPKLLDYDDMIPYYLTRTDITQLPRQTGFKFPPNTYVVVVPKRWTTGMKHESISPLMESVKSFERVYQIKRQGGIILSIYYKSSN